QLIASGHSLRSEEETNDYKKIVQSISPLVGDAGVSIEVFADLGTTAGQICVGFILLLGHARRIRSPFRRGSSSFRSQFESTPRSKSRITNGIEVTLKKPVMTGADSKLPQRRQESWLYFQGRISTSDLRRKCS
ncbi:MAG: hypothetical protein WAN18_26515, partial [Candidatus Sulfotelmatobacter sp.]